MVQEQSLGEATGTPQRAGCYPSLNHACIWHSAVGRPVLAALRERASPRPAASSKDRPDRPDRSDRPGRRFPGPSLPAMGHRLPAPGSEFRVSGSEFRLPGSRPPAPCCARPPQPTRLRSRRFRLAAARPGCYDSNVAGSASRAARPPGDETFPDSISRLVGRDLAPRKRGRKPNTPRRPKRGAPAAAKEKEKQVLCRPISTGVRNPEHGTRNREYGAHRW